MVEVAQGGAKIMLSKNNVKNNVKQKYRYPPEWQQHHGGGGPRGCKNNVKQK